MSISDIFVVRISIRRKLLSGPVVLLMDKEAVPTHRLNPTLILPKFCLTDALPTPYRCLTENSL